MGANRSRWVIGLITALGLVAVALFLRTRGPANEVGVVRRLPDGSTLELRQVAFTNGFQYHHQTGNRLQRLIGPIMPAFVRNRFFSSGSGSFGFGNDGNANLFAITVNRGGVINSSLARLRVFDEQGNFYDASWGANTLGFPGEVAQGWQIRAFPRRSKTVGLRFLAPTADGGWTNAAEFVVRNPACADYPQWTPEPWPSTKSDGNLAVTLGEFQSGGRMSGNRGRGDEQTAPRKTRVAFDFTEADRPANGSWRIQKLTISDVTGNRWSPYLDFVDQDLDWATNGTVEFFGALWPGEDAWKLEAECVRTAGFSADELWEAPPIQLPAFGQLTDLTNNWRHDGIAIRLIALASPNTDHSGSFKWVAKWWGEDKNKVYSLALKLGPELKSHRLSVVQAVDQDGREIEIVQHGNQDYVEQAVFLKPRPESRGLKLTFALQRSRFVRFLARPQFVKDNGASNPVKNGIR
ncbi:MAG TPA: hypothetical protein VN887_02185 [Candidatus Angelobacter sp.]|nr:hypothetical protein [Candidatus Angelobacter sp.]